VFPRNAIRIELMARGKVCEAEKLLRWYDLHRRDLPWRNRPSDPYRVMVSEFMLQQTQVATVVPYFERFMGRFGTISELAAADEQEVLRLWQGLGYYSRARNLHATANRIVAEHGGEVPREVEALMGLPGIGRYTAGAIASIAFDERAAILDGNVKRVICRLDKIRKPDVEVLWRRAEEMVPARRAGDFNSALMELGATVCTPRKPRCGECPLAFGCKARLAGVQEEIPEGKTGKALPLEKRWVFGVERRGKWLIEQRPAKGRWGKMWQFLTVEEGEGDLGEWEKIGVVEHVLSHRRYRFTAFVGNPHPSPLPAYRARGSEGKKVRRWVTLDQLDRYPMSKPQIRIAGMIRERLK
jgi:A/G-specific adenine glycosylase